MVGSVEPVPVSLDSRLSAVADLLGGPRCADQLRLPVVTDPYHQAGKFEDALHGCGRVDFHGCTSSASMVKSTVLTPVPDSLNVPSGSGSQVSARGLSFSFWRGPLAQMATSR